LCNPVGESQISFLHSIRIEQPTPDILNAGKATFDLLSADIAPKLPAILGALFAPILSMRRDHLNAAFIKASLIKAIVGLIPDDPIGSMLVEAIIDSGFNQGHLMGRSAFHVSGDRNTRSVCDGHDFGALATLCFANSKTPFFGGTKVSSIKASRMSIPPHSYRSCLSSWTIRRNTPRRTHCWNRLWHFWCGGYLGGRSFHGAPVRRIQNILSNTSRASRGFSPRGSLEGVIAIIMGSSLFVSFILIILHIQNRRYGLILNDFRYL
jgi:hypothetical protein